MIARVGGRGQHHSAVGYHRREGGEHALIMRVCVYFVDAIGCWCVC